MVVVIPRTVQAIAIILNCQIEDGITKNKIRASVIIVIFAPKLNPFLNDIS